MKAAVYLNHMRNGQVSEHMRGISTGLARHGIDVRQFRDEPDLTADFAVVWGWRRGEILRALKFSRPILVLERGYLGDRWEWTSMGWDGLNGRARFPKAQDGGERFWSNFGHRACEWERISGYYLVIGQVLGDMALKMVNFQRWLAETIAGFDGIGADVLFRPHPEALRRGQRFEVPDYLISAGSLDEALAGAACVVTWNSNTGVDAVLAGVPAITMDEGAMALPVSSHSIYDPLVTPDRTEWFRDMAWKQWTMDEISSGEAWEVVKCAM